MAVNDSYTTNAVGMVSQAAPGVLANDTDANHDPLTAVLVSEPANGSLQLDADDLLIAGYTDLDANAAALCAVLDEWSSADAYSARVASLGSVLNATTVHDDEVANQLLGGPGTDWFFLDTNRDKLNGARAGEVITNTAGW